MFTEFTCSLNQFPNPAKNTGLITAIICSHKGQLLEKQSKSALHIARHLRTVRPMNLINEYFDNEVPVPSCCRTLF